MWNQFNLLSFNPFSCESATAGPVGSGAESIAGPEVGQSHFISSLLNRNDDLKSKFAFARIGGDSGGIGRHTASDVTTGALGLIVRNLDLTKK